MLAAAAAVVVTIALVAEEVETSSRGCQSQSTLAGPDGSRSRAHRSRRTAGRTRRIGPRVLEPLPRTRFHGVESARSILWPHVQLWVVTAQAPISAGLLQPDSDGRVARPFSVPSTIPMPVAMAITIEPEGGVPAPTGEKYLTAPLDEWCLFRNLVCLASGYLVID